MTGVYDPVLVALSYSIAAIASYVALDLASRVSVARGRVATYWLLGGAVAMGIGIWSMHFIGMLAFHLPITTSYDVPTTLLSMLIAVFVSAIAFFTICGKTLGWGRLCVSGTLMGIGIAGMHYTGMAAMRMFPPIRYDATLLALSIVIAILTSVVALRIGFGLRFRTASNAARSASALVMGLAIAGMHYTGMLAADFDANSIGLAGPQRINNLWLAMTVACYAVLLLAGTISIRSEGPSAITSHRHAPSIRMQISAGFLAMGLLVATVVVTALWAQLEAAERASVLEARNVARAIALGSGESAITNPGSIQSQISNLHNREERDLFVVDLHKRIVADVISAEIGTTFAGDANDAIGKTLTDGQPRTFDEYQDSPPRVSKQLVAPLRKDPSDQQSPIVGAVIVEYTLIYEALQAEAWTMTQILAGVSVGIMFLAAILGIRIASAIASPIVELERSAAALAAGNYDARVKVQSNDEIGGLAAAFNRMAEDLSVSHAELLEHRRELEHQVARRTTEWQQAMAAAEESAAELTLLTDLMPVSLSYVDSERRVRYHNRVFAEWKGEEEIDGRTVAEVLGLDVYAAVKDRIDQALAGLHVSYERPNRTGDGRVQFLTTHLMPRLGSGGEVIGFYSMSQDISERKRAEEALRQRNEELGQINQRLREAHDQLLQAEKMASIGQLASGVAHEINNPVGYVYSNLSTLDRYLANIFTLLDAYHVAEGSIADKTVRDDLQSARRVADIEFVRADVLALLSESREGITRVTKIVQDLKNFSRSATDENWQRADIHQGIDSTLNVIWNELKYKADVHKEYGQLPQVQCRPSQLNQVFMNMLLNAAQAIKERGAITIRTGVEGGDAWIEIADTGAGIKPAHLSRVFDPFFTTKPVGKGTGLGLSVSYGIVKEHGGRIDVESKVGKGTVFRVWLPIDQREPAAAAASEASMRPAAAAVPREIV